MAKAVPLPVSTLPKCLATHLHQRFLTTCSVKAKPTPKKRTKKTVDADNGDNEEDEEDLSPKKKRKPPRWCQVVLPPGG